MAIFYFFLPGWSFLAAYFPTPRTLLERIILACGLSYALSLMGLLYLIYLPGHLSPPLLTGATLAFIWLNLILADRRPTPAETFNVEPPSMLLIAFGLFALAWLMRWPLLGYTEFHEDEIEVLSFAARILGGEEYTLFLHRKGPMQTLLPLFAWFHTATITEWVSRVMFTSASVGGVLSVYLLGRRLSGQWWVGAIAGLLMALNGLSVAFGRLVQYQALILFLGPLIILVMDYARTEARYRWLGVAALLWSVCLLAHFDALLYAPAIGYLTWRIFQSAPPTARRRFFAWLGGSVGLATILLASFYLPYVRDPQFAHTLTYLSESRVGGDLFYNNLDIWADVEQRYNSIYSLGLLWFLTLAFFWHRFTSRQARLRLVAVAGLLLSTFWFDGWWDLGRWDLAVWPWFAVGCIGLWKFAQSSRPNEQLDVLWVWWLTSFSAYVFLVDAPGTHFYIAYSAWVILAAWGAWRLFQALPSGSLRWGAGVTGTVLAAILFGYQALLFWQTDQAYAQPPALSHLYGELPPQYSYFGAPRQLGWKAFGALLETDQVQGDYRTANEIFSVPVWYTLGRSRSCFDTPDYYVLALEKDPLGNDVANLPPDYHQTGLILVDDTPRLAIYERKAPAPATPTEYSFEQLAPQFDQAATWQRLAQRPPLAVPLTANFGDLIALSGFTLSPQSVAPGSRLDVTLRWEALQATPTRYRAFLHLVELDDPGTRWGQHDDDPVCRLPTSLWRPGQTAEGHFRILVDPATPPGQYQLRLGLYHPETGERLPLLSPEGQILGDSLALTTVSVE